MKKHTISCLNESRIYRPFSQKRHTPFSMSLSMRTPQSRIIRLRKIVIMQRSRSKALRLHPPPYSHIANFTDLLPRSLPPGGTSRSTVASLDAVPPTPRRLRSWRLALCSRVSLAHSAAVFSFATEHRQWLQLVGTQCRSDQFHRRQGR
jgi:hypothetical protein